MKLGSDSPAGHPFNVGLEALKREVESRTQGRIKATIFPDAQLGGEEAMTAGLKIGSVDALFASPGPLGRAIPELGIFEMFFLFRDADHLLKAVNGPLGDRFKDRIAAAVGGEVGGWGMTGSRNMWNSRRPIKRLEDVKGLKMRVQASRIQQDMYSALGALATPIPFVEVYTALQTGVVDGADIGLSDMLPLKFYEVTKYLTKTGHFFMLNPFLVSKRFLERISPQDREIVREAAKKCVEAELAVDRDFEVKGFDELKKKGIQIFEFEPKDRQAFVKAVEPAYAKHAATVGGMSVINQIREIR